MDAPKRIQRKRTRMIIGYVLMALPAVSITIFNFHQNWKLSLIYYAGAVGIFGLIAFGCYLVSGRGAD